MPRRGGGGFAVFSKAVRTYLCFYVCCCCVCVFPSFLTHFLSFFSFSNPKGHPGKISTCSEKTTVSRSLPAKKDKAGQKAVKKHALEVHTRNGVHIFIFFLPSQQKGKRIRTGHVYIAINVLSFDLYAGKPPFPPPFPRAAFFLPVCPFQSRLSLSRNKFPPFKEQKEERAGGGETLIYFRGGLPSCAIRSRGGGGEERESEIWKAIPREQQGRKKGLKTQFYVFVPSRQQKFDAKRQSEA